MKRIFVLLILSLFLCGLVTTGVTTLPVENNSYSVSDGESSPIYINDNSDFESYASSGLGTANDPYIITDLDLVDHGDACVYIINTSAYVILQYLNLSGDGYYGIYLNNVFNLNITTNNIIEKKAGISIDNCSRIFVNDTTIRDVFDGDYGILINLSDNISIRNCHIYETRDGMRLLNSFRVEVVDNEFIGSGISFYQTCQVSTGVLITGNTVNGKLLGYLYNHHDARYNISAYGQVILVSCVNITLYGGNINDTSIGVQFIFCQSCVIANSVITNNYRGILVYESAYCRIYGNNVTDNNHGLFGYFATGTIVDENNFLSNNGFGVWLDYGCSSSAVYLNNFIDNVLGNSRDDGGIEDSNLIWLGARFINSVSGQPLSNVSVTIQKDGRSYTGYSNEYGLFKVPLPELGEYNFTISRFRYQTKQYLNYNINTYGIHLYQIELEKANLGPGTGYVLARFMNGVTPIGNVNVKVYAYLDGAYYFHSQYVSTIVTPVGWVNITGLYYDNYFFVITHLDYERKIINQIVVSNGYIGTYNNIQLTAYPTNAFIYGYVYDFTNNSEIFNANITIYNETRGIMTEFTDINGFANITNIPFGVYMAEISKNGYLTVEEEFIIDEAGNQSFNPFAIYMIPSYYAPETPLQGLLNNWDNELDGNYWDDYSGLVTSTTILSDDIGYEIPGNNIGNPVDEYPLLEPHIRINIIVTTTTTTVTDEITNISELMDGLWLIVGASVGIIILIIVLIIKKEKF